METGKSKFELSLEKEALQEKFQTAWIDVFIWWSI